MEAQELAQGNPCEHDVRRWAEPSHIISWPAVRLHC